eukprot:CAMPEP_0113712428 /NCGR_PEP_ID=MMETSP0038_2-20120614/31382_1 /TAXON_ID=2898 /ORGANISM="Cryptomonas paramecium" /LENGTH=38 /DNA_ID=CAMNT_0000638945 /DNA_START=132 /DNA_END=244 /DNA_ORIENTATION=+ /assembly_acc=CAM_ASM_000170
MNTPIHGLSSLIRLRHVDNQDSVLCEEAHMRRIYRMKT